MFIDLTAVPRAQRYKALAGAIVPRPIAWVGTLNPDDTVNLAPFSFFAPMSSTPPILGFTVETRPEGATRPKDTLANIVEREEFVIHIPSQDDAQLVHQTAVDYAPGVSEVSENGLDVVPSNQIKTPRLSRAAVAYECKLLSIIELSPGPHWVMGEPLVAHFGPGVMTETGRIDYTRFAPLGRLVADGYLVDSRVIELERDWDVPRFDSSREYP